MGADSSGTVDRGVVLARSRRIEIGLNGPLTNCRAVTLLLRDAHHNVSGLCRGCLPALMPMTDRLGVPQLGQDQSGAIPGLATLLNDAMNYRFGLTAALGPQRPSPIQVACFK